MSKAINIKDALTPSLLKEVISNDLLKGVMTDALVSRGLCTDFDTALKPGYYRAARQMGTINYPPGAYQWGILEVLATAEFTLQRYTPHQFGSSKALYYRMSSQGVWNPWILISGQELTS